MSRLETIIAAHPFFQGITREFLSVVAHDAREAKIEAGQYLFEEGDYAAEFYLIQRGLVAARSRGGATPPQTLAGGDVLGWSWLFPPFNWQFEVRALELTDVIVLHGTNILLACDADHALGYELMKRVAINVAQRAEALRMPAPARPPVHRAFSAATVPGFSLAQAFSR